MAENGVKISDNDVLASAEYLLVLNEGTSGLFTVAGLGTLLAGGGVLVGTPTTDALSARITAVEDQAFAESPIYDTTAEGIAATGEGDRFRVENGDAAIAYDIYDHDAGGVATFLTDIPAGSALVTKPTISNALSEYAPQATTARANIGAASAAVLSDVSLAVGDVAARTQGIYSDGEVIQFDPVVDGAADGETGMVFAITDANDQACFAISPEGGVYIAQLYTQDFVFDQLSAETYAIEDDTSLGYAFAIADANERIGFGVRQTGEVDIKGGARLGGQAAGWDFVIVDGNDRIGMGLKNGVLYVPQISAEGQTTSNTNLRNMLFSDKVRLATPMVQLPVAQYNTIMNYGQSLGEGNETWPSLSKLWQQGALMVGDNVDNLGVETYDAMGVDQFNPLVANTHNNVSNLTGAEEALLSPGDNNKGEPPVIGLTNGLKFWMNRRALALDDGRNLVAMSSAQAGRTIAQLSRVNSQDAVDRWGGMISGIQLAKDLADAAGATCVCPILTWIQGEFDYNTNNGSTNATRALYRAALETLFDDANTDIPAITGQGLPPLKLMYQTGGSYTRDADMNGAPDLHVGMAQLEVAIARDDVVMVGPVYPYTDKGGHLDSNGARWYGHQQAKVAAKILAGEGWQPLRPIEIEKSGATIFVHYHVPQPPLRFAPTYWSYFEGFDYADKGFAVTSADAATVYAVEAVQIVSDTIIAITCAVEPPDDALLWYADLNIANHDGQGNVCDSDPTLAIDRYEYVPERGMYASANRPELVGRRYDLRNWSVAFVHPITYSEF